MVLEDIVFCEGEIQNFIITLERGNSGTVNDIETESSRNAGMLVNELPVIVNTSTTTAFTWVG